MDKQHFLNVFGKNVQTNITDRFFADDIHVFQDEATVDEIKKYFIPVFDNNNKKDNRKIEDQILDQTLKPVTVGKALKNPAMWDMDFGNRTMPDSINSVLVATDLNSGASLLLDSNHTVINYLKDNPHPKTRLEIIRITGNDLGDLVPDFHIINRQRRER
jgi:hypothetical protein